ncbi:MAG: hypothetical protein N2039_06440 [Gemmataceae bacterium]|nr:hypothetical protein [Gemmataceae bacterium]
MGVRRTRKNQIQADQARSRRENGERKSKERARRDERMRNLIRSGKPPYTPAVQSWLSAKLGKPARLITAEDIQAALQS